MIIFGLVLNECPTVLTEMTLLFLILCYIELMPNIIYDVYVVRRININQSPPFQLIVFRLKLVDLFVTH